MDVLTTGEVAKRCGVTVRTVQRWLDRGLLKSFQLPGRGDHRVAVEELRRFMRDHGIPDAPLVDQSRTTGTITDQDHATPRRVLIADDERYMANAIARVLNGAGYQTSIASSGFEAGALLHSFAPHVLTLDLRMPGLDGIGVLQVINKIAFAQPLKVLVVSADSDVRLNEATQLGAHAVLRKPFDNDALIAAVDRLAGLQRVPVQALRQTLSQV